MTQIITIEEQGRRNRKEIFEQIPLFEELSKVARGEAVSEPPVVAEILDGLAAGLTNRSRDCRAISDWIEELQRVVIQLQEAENDSDK